jgi:hypothetical protein
MKKAEITNNTVVNIIEVDPNNIPDWCADWPEATEDAAIGGTCDGTTFTRPVIVQPVPNSITFAQLLIGLVTETWITEAEGTAWLQGVLPAAVETLITSLPQEQQFIARARASRPSEVLRDDPLVVALGAAQGKTEEELDDFFITYSGV